MWRGVLLVLLNVATTEAACTDYVNWQSSRSATRTCSSPVSEVCTQAEYSASGGGAVVEGWHPPDRALTQAYSTYTHLQVWASNTACCACGGGVDLATCVDTANWISDKFDRTCATGTTGKYLGEFNEMCSQYEYKNGKNKMNAAAAAGTGPSHPGKGAQDACCKCGGGVKAAVNPTGALTTTTTTTTSTVLTTTTTTTTTTTAANTTALTAPSIQANTQNVKEVQVVKIAFSVSNLKHGSLNVATTTAIKAATVSLFARTMRTKPGNIDVAITNPFATTAAATVALTTKAATTTTVALTTTTTAAGRRLNTAFINIGVTIVAEKGETFATVKVPSGTAIATALDKVDNINNAKGNSALSLTTSPMSVVKWEAKATSGTVIAAAALKEVKVGMDFPMENTDYFGMHFGNCGKGWIKTVKKGQGTEKFSGTIADCVKLCFADVCCSFISHDRFAEKCSLYKNKGCPRYEKVTRYPTFASYAIFRDSERSHLVVV